MRPDVVLSHWAEEPGNRSARSGMRQALLRGGGLASNFVCRCRWLVADICHRPSPTNNKPERGNATSIHFAVPAQANAIRDKLRTCVQEECIRAQKELDTDT